MYQFTFDDTKVGDVCYSRSACELLISALALLKDKINSWNAVAIEHGAIAGAYVEEVSLLSDIIDWYQQELAANPSVLQVTAQGVSVGSLSYHKAALIHPAWGQEEKLDKTVGPDWPSAVQGSMRAGVKNLRQLADKINIAPAAILDELRPDFGLQMHSSVSGESWDVFISHAHEDKTSLAAPLATELQTRNLRVWYDEFTLKVGDSLRRSIDRGLARSRFGIVILSPSRPVKATNASALLTGTRSRVLTRAVPTTGPTPEIVHTRVKFCLRSGLASGQ